MKIPGHVMRIIRSLSLTLFIFGLLGWLYLILMLVVYPDTLSMPLTHLLPYPREDTFGMICFAISMVSFFVWRMSKEP